MIRRPPRSTLFPSTTLSRFFFFDWGGDPTTMALGLAFFGAAQDGPIAALFLAGAAATHPMGACAGALAVLWRRSWRPAMWVSVGLLVVLGMLALLGPSLSPREAQWIRDYALGAERGGAGVLGDPAHVATALAAAWRLWGRPFPPGVAA